MITPLRKHASAYCGGRIRKQPSNSCVKHGRELQQAGADARELNTYYVEADTKQSSAELEARYLELVRELRSQVIIPITVKLPSQFTTIPHFVKQLESAGADGAALFNRFYQPDIDLETLQVTSQLPRSSSHPPTPCLPYVGLPSCTGAWNFPWLQPVVSTLPGTPSRCC